MQEASDLHILDICRISKLRKIFTTFIDEIGKLQQRSCEIQVAHAEMVAMASKLYASQLVGSDIDYQPLMAFLARLRELQDEGGELDKQSRKFDKRSSELDNRRRELRTRRLELRNRKLQVEREIVELQQQKNALIL